MKKVLLTSLAIAVSVGAGQVAFAKSGSGKQLLTHQLSKHDVLAAAQGYILTRAKRPQARRSALFAQIKSGIAKRPTLARADISAARKSWLVLK